MKSTLIMFYLARKSLRFTSVFAPLSLSLSFSSETADGLVEANHRDAAEEQKQNSNTRFIIVPLLLIIHPLL